MKSLRKILEQIQAVIYIAMAVLFSILVFIYFDYIFVRSTRFFLPAALIITVMMVIDYFSRRYVTNVLVFYGVHLAMIAAAAAIPQVILDKVVLGVVAFAYLILAHGFWRSEANERTMYVIDIPFGVVMFFVLAYFHASISKNITDSIASYAYIAGVIYCLLFYTREYINKFLAYHLSSGNNSIELESTFSTNISLILFFNLIMVFFIVVLNLFFGDSKMNFIGRFFKFIGRKFFGLFPTKPERVDIVNTVSVDIEPVTGTVEQQATGTVLSGAKTGSQIVENVFEISMVVLFIIALVVIAIAAYKFIKSYLHRHNKTGDIIEKTTFKDKKETVAAPQEEKKSFLFGSNKRKIRKLYTERIKGLKKKDAGLMIRESYTPDEIAARILAKEPVNRSNLEVLTKMYQIARYSNQEISKNDVEVVKEAVRS